MQGCFWVLLSDSALQCCFATLLWGSAFETCFAPPLLNFALQMLLLNTHACRLGVLRVASTWLRMPFSVRSIRSPMSFIWQLRLGSDRCIRCHLWTIFVKHPSGRCIRRVYPTVFVLHISYVEQCPDLRTWSRVNSTLWGFGLGLTSVSGVVLFRPLLYSQQNITYAEKCRIFAMGTARTDC